MRHVSVAELKANAEELIAAAEAGEEIVIAGDRNTVRLVSSEPHISADAPAVLAERRAALDDLTKFRAELRAKGSTVSAAEVKEWINEGRR